MQAFHAAVAERDAALTIDDRARLALLLGHGVMPIRTGEDFDDLALIVKLYGQHHPQPRT